MRKIVFELCADNIAACVAARAGGADRIELCAALGEGGLTPSHGLICESIDRTGLPVHVMLRPRGQDFVYSEEEFAVMCRDLEHIRSLGVSGMVLGILRADDRVDVERTTLLVEMAAPLEVTFHRAFDQTVNLSEALEDVIRTGCRRLLTSGGEHDVGKGAHSISQLVMQAAGRIEIAVGGGLCLQNATALVRATGARHFHGSLRRFMIESTTEDGPTILEDPDPISPMRTFVDTRDIRAMIEKLGAA